MLKVKVIWSFSVESLELLLANLLHIPDSLSCSNTCNFLCVKDSHIHAFFLKGVAKLFYSADNGADIIGERCLHTWCVIVMTCVLSPPTMLVAISKLFYGHSNFWPGNHPTQQGTWVVNDADCSAISFDQSVVLFMRLVDWDRTEQVIRIPYSEVASPKLLGYTCVLHWEFYRVPQVNRDPPGIVCVWSNAWNHGTSSVRAASYIANEACLGERTKTSTSKSSSSTFAQY